MIIPKTFFSSVEHKIRFFDKYPGRFFYIMKIRGQKLIFIIFIYYSIYEYFELAFIFIFSVFKFKYIFMFCCYFYFCLASVFYFIFSIC